MDKSFRKKEVLKNKNENVTTQVAIQNTRDGTHPGVLNDLSLEHTLTTMKTAIFFSKEKNDVTVT